MTDYRDFYHQLREDWLQLRDCLYDHGTRLPCLPAVLEGVCRRLQDGQSMGMIYLDPSDSGQLEKACGWQVYDQLVAELAHVVQRYVRRHLEEGDCLAVGGVHGDELIIFMALGEAGRSALEAHRSALEAEVRSRLERYVEDHPGAIPTLQSIALPLEPSTQVRLERTLQHTLLEARMHCHKASQQRQSKQLSELERMLSQRDLIVRFQPIMSLATGVVHGFEALSAAPSRKIFENPEKLFIFAEQSDAINDLERLCRRSAVQRVAPLIERYPGSKVFINCSAHAFNDPELIIDLVEGALVAGCEPRDMVIEVTERVAITEWNEFRQVLSDLRYAGLRIAIDDMGSGYSSLQAVAEVEPDYLKFDFSLVHDLHRSAIKRDLVETLVTLAEKIGALPIAEGIECREELVALQAMGVGYGQGYLLSRPALAEQLGDVAMPSSVS